MATKNIGVALRGLHEGQKKEIERLTKECNRLNNRNALLVKALTDMMDAATSEGAGPAMRSAYGKAATALHSEGLA